MSDKPIRETSTHTYYQGPLGEIAVPKKTRQCSVCGEREFLTGEAITKHHKHGGKLLRAVDRMESQS